MAYMAQLTGKTRGRAGARSLQGRSTVPCRTREDGEHRACSAMSPPTNTSPATSGKSSHAARRPPKRTPRFADQLRYLCAGSMRMPKNLDALRRSTCGWARPGSTKPIFRHFLQETVSAAFLCPKHRQGELRARYRRVVYRRTKAAFPITIVAAHTTYGTARASAYRILEDTLNLRDVRVYDTVQDADGKRKAGAEQEGNHPGPAEAAGHQGRLPGLDLAGRGPAAGADETLQRSVQLHPAPGVQRRAYHLHRHESRKFACGPISGTPSPISCTAETRCWPTKWGLGRRLKWWPPSWKASGWGSARKRCSPCPTI